MNSYRVRWEIEVDALSPLEAAHRARAVQLDPESADTIFTVNHEPGAGEDDQGEAEIDLSPLPGPFSRPSPGRISKTKWGWSLTVEPWDLAEGLVASASEPFQLTALAAELNISPIDWA